MTDQRIPALTYIPLSVLTDLPKKQRALARAIQAGPIDFQAKHSAAVIAFCDARDFANRSVASFREIAQLLEGDALLAAYQLAQEAQLIFTTMERAYGNIGSQVTFKDVYCTEVVVIATVRALTDSAAQIDAVMARFAE